MIKIYTIFTQQQDTNSIQVLWGLSYQGTNPIHEGSTLMTYSPLKPLILSHWVLGFMNYGRQYGQPKAISTQMKNTSDSYLPGEPQPFLLTGLFFRACWGILGGMGSISCCRALLFADRSRDCPPMLPSTPLRHRHLDPSPSRGRLPRAICPPHWPTLGPLLWAQSPSGCWSIWVTGSQRGCVLSCAFPAPLVMNGGHMSGEQECIWSGRCDFQEGGGFWQQVALMAEGWQFAIGRASLCRGRAQSLVFDPELTRVTFKSSVRNLKIEPREI